MSYNTALVFADVTSLKDQLTSSSHIIKYLIKSSSWYRLKTKRIVNQFMLQEMHLNLSSLDLAQ